MNIRGAPLRLAWLIVLAGAAVSRGDLDQVRIRLQTTDVQGNPVSAISAGDDFFVQTFVQDLREAAPLGVFATYLDLSYPESLVSVDGSIAFAAPYANGRSGAVDMPGLVDEVGAFAGLSMPDAEERLLFSLEFHADSAGNAVFSAAPADLLGADVLIYGSDEVVSPELVDYGQTLVAIAPPQCDITQVVGPLGDLDGDGGVGFGDFLILSANFGEQAEYGGGDLDCDGAVGFADFLLVSESFGLAKTSVANVPEAMPSLMLVLVIAAPFVRRCWVGGESPLEVHSRTPNPFTLQGGAATRTHPTI